MGEAFHGGIFFAPEELTESVEHISGLPITDILGMSSTPEFDVQVYIWKFGPLNVKWDEIAVSEGADISAMIREIDEELGDSDEC